MNSILLNIFKGMIEEFNYEVQPGHRKGCITFHPKNTLSRETIHNYRLAIKDSNVYIFRIFLRVTTKGAVHTIPDNKILLSVDLHDPRSLKAIRDWLESL